MLSIWRPSEEVMHMLSEGSRLRIYHLTTAGVRLQIVLLFVFLFSCSRGFLQYYIEVTLFFITCEVYRTLLIVYSRCFNFCFFRNRQGASELQASTNQYMKIRDCLGPNIHRSVYSLILLSSIISRWSGKEPAFLPDPFLGGTFTGCEKAVQIEATVLLHMSVSFAAMCRILFHWAPFKSLRCFRVTLPLSNKSFQQHERQDMKSCRVTRMSKEWFTRLDRYAIELNFISNGTVLATLNLNSLH